MAIKLTKYRKYKFQPGSGLAGLERLFLAGVLHARTYEAAASPLPSFLRK